MIGTRTIRDWLSVELRLPHGKEPEVVCVAPNVFRATCPPLPMVAVKICRDGDTGEPSHEQAEAQYRSLMTVGRQLGRAVAVAVPILRDRPCLVTEWVEGRSAFRHWRDWRNNRHRLVESAYRAGSWLRSFHDGRSLPNRPLAVDRMLEWLHELRQAACAEFRSSEVAGTAFQLLENVGKDLRDAVLPESWSHGDFKPANLILTERSAVGIDLTLREDAPIVQDIVPFLLELALMCFEPASCRLTLYRTEMENGFLAGYARDREFPYRVELAWATLYLALCIWAARENPKRRNTRNLFLRKRLQLIVPRLTRELAAARSQISRMPQCRASSGS